MVTVHNKCYGAAETEGKAGTMIMLYSLFRLKDYHQRSAECRQTIGGGHDAHHLLPDGLCPICTSGNITTELL